MFSTRNLHRNESGQAALENAIILIAFIVVASVFAFTILSAGSSSTEKGEQAIYQGLEGVQSSMAIKGAVVADGTGSGSAETVSDVRFTVSLAGGSEPVDLTDDTTTRVVVIGYRDSAQFISDVPFTTAFIVNNGTEDVMLEDGELAEITVDLSGLATLTGGVQALSSNTAFTLELKPPSGAVLSVNRTTPASIEPVMELR